MLLVVASASEQVDGEPDGHRDPGGGPIDGQTERRHCNDGHSHAQYARPALAAPPIHPSRRFVRHCRKSRLGPIVVSSTSSATSATSGSWPTSWKVTLAVRKGVDRAHAAAPEPASTRGLELRRPPGAATLVLPDDYLAREERVFLFPP